MAKRLCEIFGRMKVEAVEEGRRERNKFVNEDVGMSQLRNPLSLPSHRSRIEKMCACAYCRLVCSSKPEELAA